MTSLGGRPPPLSPLLVAGMLLRPLPPGLLSPLLGVALTAMRRRHPHIFERLAELGDTTFRIDPSDLPFALLLRLGPSPRLEAVADEAASDAVTATVRGPLLLLLDLLEGRLDGDAVFFSRDIVIDGDTEAVLALRNALESDEVDVLDDLLSVLGPLHRPARRIAGIGGALLSRAARDLETVRAAAVAPLARQAERQAADLHDLAARVDALSQRGGSRGR